MSGPWHRPGGLPLAGALAGLAAPVPIGLFLLRDTLLSSPMSPPVEIGVRSVMVAITLALVGAAIAVSRAMRPAWSSSSSTRPG